MLVKDLIKELEKLNGNAAIECSNSCLKCKEIKFFDKIQIVSNEEVINHIKEMGFDFSEELMADYYI